MRAKLSLNSALYAFVPGGNVNGGTLYNAANNGNYWSSRSNSDTNAYNLNFNTSGVNPSSYSNRYYARSVRCVAR